MSVIDTLVFDRTQEDVDEAISILKSGVLPPQNHKGCYNLTDLNRVGEAVNFLKQRFPSVGMDFDFEQAKTDWTSDDIPTEETSGKLIDLLFVIKVFCVDYRPTAEAPDSFRFLGFNEANQIESLLKIADEVISKIILSYRGYSGRLSSGVNCLP